MLSRSIIMFSLTLTLLSCERARLDYDDPNGGRNPGDNSGQGDPGRKGECGEATRGIGLWLDARKNINADFDFKGIKPLKTVTPFTGETNARANYGYNNLSAHLKAGPELIAQQGQHFFFQGKDGLSFFMVFGKEDIPFDLGRVKVKVHVRNNVQENGLGADRVLFSDEPRGRDELQEPAEFRLVDSSPGVRNYSGEFLMNEETDGAIVGPLIREGFEISISYHKRWVPNDLLLSSSTGDAFSIGSEISRAQMEQAKFILKDGLFDTCGLLK